MARLFLRNWSVKATKLGVLTETRTWTELDIEFDVEKTDDRGINEGEITLINLNADSRKFLSNRFIQIELEAGYIDETVAVFTGEAEFCTSALDGPNWKTTLEVRDGAKIARTKKGDKSFKKNTQNKALFNYLIGLLTKSDDPNILPLDKGVIDLSTVTGSIAKSKSFRNLAYNDLYTLCQGFSLDMFVTDNKLNIKQKGQNLLTEIPVLSRNSGLIGTPEVTEDGIKVFALMQRGFDPGSVFDLDSVVNKGRYRVRNARYKGTSDAGDWGIEIEAVTHG